MASPNHTGDTTLTSVAGTGAGDVWAVGRWEDGSSSGPVIEHFDGTAWSIVRSPDGQELSGVAALTRADAWAVGTGVVSRPSVRRVSLVEHWDGHAWTSVTAPSVGRENNYLLGVAAFGRSNVWALGQYLDDETGKPLVEHWDGQAWSVAGIDPAITGLGSDAALLGSDLWVAGGFGGALGDGTFLRWDGSSWHLEKGPSLGAESSLAGVSFRNESDGWAVGEYFDAKNRWHALAGHWDGSAWTVVSTGVSDALSSGLGGVQPVGPEVAVAAGYLQLGGEARPAIVTLQSG